MKRFLVSIAQSLASTLVFLLFLEGACWVVGFPQGAPRYYEGVVVKSKLSPYKPNGEFRIFTYGESSMHGSHYGPTSNPARWLEVYLKDFLPADQKVRVVNFSRMGSGPHVVYQAFHDTAGYRPDLAIFYLGHNQFLPGNRKDQVLAKERKVSYFWKKLMRQSRLYSAMYRLAVGVRYKTKKEDPEEDSIEYKIIETMPWGIGPENAVPNNTPAYQENIDFFRQDAEKIARLARKKGIKVIFCKPAGNLKDFSPFMSLHMKEIKPEDLKVWEENYENGKKAEAVGRNSDALLFYNKAYQIDDTYADLNFRMGSLYFKQGELGKAKTLFEAARDYDAIKVRASRDILDIFDQLQAKDQVPVLDTEKALISEAPGGILGNPVIEDNVHMSVRGHSLLARALVQEIADREWILPKAKWRFDKERGFEEISKELGVNPDLIFAADIKMVPYFGSRYVNRIYFAQKALEIYPGHPKALRHLAWSYWLQGDKDKALEIYLKLNEKNPEALQEVFHNREDIKKAYLEKFPAVKA